MHKHLLSVVGCAMLFAQAAFAVDFPAAEDGVITLTTAGEYTAAVPTSTKLVVNANGTVKLSSKAKYSRWRWGQALGKLCAIGLCGIPGAGARREWWGAIV